MSYTLRKAQGNLEALELFQPLQRMLSYSKAPQMQLVEEAVAYRNFKAAIEEGRVYVIGDYAVFVDVGSPWHTSKRVLIEEVIFRWRRHFGNDVQEAVDSLVKIAREHGCVAVAAGDTQVGLMEPRYLAAGFIRLGTQFYKELP